MGTRAVAAALVALALAIGMLVGAAIPRETEATHVSPSAGEDAQAALADVAQRDRWLEELSAASVAGTLDGTSVAILVADGASTEQVDQVTAALAQAGASVGVQASLSAEWWTPEMGAYRGEIADQLTDSVAGVEGLASTEVLQHAIVQALVPDAVPAGAEAPGDVGQDFPSDGVAADRAEVLLEVLRRSGLVTVDAPATGPVDALVVVAADGPAGAGTVADLAASVWEQYVPATLLVVFGSGDAQADLPTVATDAMDYGETLPIANRPSVVVATESSLVAPQVVFALVEQANGGSGDYGVAEDLPLIATN